jgi:hypothetical protein
MPHAVYKGRGGGGGKRNMAAGSVALSTPQACIAGDAVSNLHRLSAYLASFGLLCAVEIRLQVTVPRIALEWVSVRRRFKLRKLCVCVCVCVLCISIA